MQQAERQGEQLATSPAVTWLARAGYVAKGVVYLIIGGLSARVAIGDGGSTTDRNGALRAIHEQPFGRFLLAAVAVGLVGYALWSLVLAVFDPDHRGTDVKGIGARVGYGAVSISYAGLAVAAAQLALGAGNGGQSSNRQTEDWTARLLGLPFGPFLVVVAGLVVVGIAGFLAYRAYKADFKKSLRQAPDWVVLLGRAGYAALGVVFLIVGIFLIVAAARHNAHAARGLSGALQELARQPYGHLILGVVAVGLVAYGLFSLAQSRYRRLGGA